MVSATILTIIGCILFLFPIIENYKHKDTMSQITKYIFLSSYNIANDHNILQKNNIKYILTIMSDDNNCVEPFCRKMKHYNDIKYFKINKNDVFVENIMESFEDAYKFIDEAIENKQNILVHCYAGISRSPTIVASYLMKKLCISRDQALDMIKQKRHIINPNSGFMQQLKKYQENIQCQL
jgi:protein-tyrosine phosphatase